MEKLNIEKLAKLAKLYLSEKAKNEIGPSIFKIIDYFGTIREIAQKSPPERLEEKFCPRRQEKEEIHKEIRCKPEYLKDLPNYKDGYFSIPKIRE